MPPEDDGVGPASSAEDLTDPESKRPDEASAILDIPPKTGDARALKRRGVVAKQQDLSDENDLRAVLASPEGVRFVARIIGGPCGWNLPYYNASNSVMCEVAGRRSIGYQLEQWISDAELELWFTVRRELEKSRPKPKTSERK